MESYQNSAQDKPPEENKLHRLSEEHARQLFEESGIDPGVALERGYYSAERRADIPEAFKDYQRRLGLVIPTYSPDGVSTSHHLRPDKPRPNKDGKPIRYESPGGSSVILDVHPRMRNEVKYGTSNLFVVEGVKKADALVSRGVPAIALTGVWMAHIPKTKPKELLPCWDHVRLEGRRVYVGFDSDWAYKEGVHAALEWLVGALEARGADVRVAYLEDAEDGSKVGADDYLAAGGAIAELKALCRRFEEQDVGRIRLSKDAKLRALTRDLEHRFWTTEWKASTESSARDLYHVLTQTAIRRGKAHKDGLRVPISHSELKRRAKIKSQDSLYSAIHKLEEMRLIYRDNAGRKRRQRGAFVVRCTPRAKPDHYRGTDPATPAQAGGAMPRGYDPSGPVLRAPRQRWPTPAYKPSKKTLKKYRKGEVSRLPERRAAIERFGKRRCFAVDVLDEVGGVMSVRDLAGALDIRRHRDLVRRSNPDSEHSRDGMLWMLQEAGVIWISEDLGTVGLTEDWLELISREYVIGAPKDIQDTHERVKSRAFHAKDLEGAEPSRGTKAGRENIERSRKAKGDYEPPAHEPTSEQERKIRRRVSEGMSARWARGSESSAGGTGLAPPRAKPKSPTDVPLVDGIYQHGAECDCEWCAA